MGNAPKWKVHEAVDYLMKSITLQYRRDMIQMWCETQGDEFAEHVKAQFKAKWDKRRR